MSQASNARRALPQLALSSSVGGAIVFQRSFFLFSTTARKGAKPACQVRTWYFGNFGMDSLSLGHRSFRKKTVNTLRLCGFGKTSRSGKNRALDNDRTPARTERSLFTARFRSTKGMLYFFGLSGGWQTRLVRLVGNTICLIDSITCRQGSQGDGLREGYVCQIIF